LKKKSLNMTGFCRVAKTDHRSQQLMELKGVGPTTAVRWSPVSVMHMILRMDATGSLAGADAITIQQRRKVKAWQDNKSR
jgi:hypothetical protein